MVLSEVKNGTDGHISLQTLTTDPSISPKPGVGQRKVLDRQRRGGRKNLPNKLLGDGYLALLLQLRERRSLLPNYLPQLR